MKEERMIVLDWLSQGDLTVAEAVTLFKVLAAIESLDLCCFGESPSLSIDVYLN